MTENIDYDFIINRYQQQLADSQLAENLALSKLNAADQELEAVKAELAQARATAQNLALSEANPPIPDSAYPVGDPTPL